MNTCPTLSGGIGYNMRYYVYVLRSLDFGRNYVGFTRNVEKRLREHNSGKTRSTMPYIPWEIILVEEFDLKEDALTREKFLKTGKGREYIKNWPRGAIRQRRTR